MNERACDEALCESLYCMPGDLYGSLQKVSALDHVNMSSSA